MFVIRAFLSLLKILAYELLAMLAILAIMLAQITPKEILAREAHANTLH